MPIPSPENDVDSQETREWPGALEGVIAHEGPERRHLFIEQPLRHANMGRVLSFPSPQQWLRRCFRAAQPHTLAGFLIACALWSSNATAAPEVDDSTRFEPMRLGISLGSGSDAAIARLQARWNLTHDLWATSSESIRLRLGLEASVGVWNPHGANSQTLGDIGFTPILRLQGQKLSGPFAEIGVGLHLLSRTHISDTKVFSTAFQFGDRFAIGYRFDDALDSEVAFRIQHYSNAGIKEPNPGINYYMLEYSARF